MRSMWNGVGRMMVIEFATHFLGSQLDDEYHYGFFNPYRQIPEYRGRTPPTHYTTEGGGQYSARPDLARTGGPAVYRALGGVALVSGSIVGAVAITSAYNEVIHDEPEHEQRSLWQVFSSGLTGTFGIGSGLNL
ncbi:MAG: hypothetical protein [Circular genetic element sp.]|nr:MAG: hypothetical protein [Circular genetic element sp.]